MGDLPPYEAFPIGGTNSVRGYSEGGVGSGRNYAAGTAEFHFPLIKPIQAGSIIHKCLLLSPSKPCFLFTIITAAGTKSRWHRRVAVSPIRPIQVVRNTQNVFC